MCVCVWASCSWDGVHLCVCVCVQSGPLRFLSPHTPGPPGEWECRARVYRRMCLRRCVILICTSASSAELGHTQGTVQEQTDPEEEERVRRLRHVCLNSRRRGTNLASTQWGRGGGQV